jgi:hypothetical protein
MIGPLPSKVEVPGIRDLLILFGDIRFIRSNTSKAGLFVFTEYFDSRAAENAKKGLPELFKSVYGLMINIERASFTSGPSKRSRVQALKEDSGIFDAAPSSLLDTSLLQSITREQNSNTPPLQLRACSPGTGPLNFKDNISAKLSKGGAMNQTSPLSSSFGGSSLVTDWSYPLMSRRASDFSYSSVQQSLRKEYFGKSLESPHEQNNLNTHSTNPAPLRNLQSQSIHPLVSASFAAKQAFISEQGQATPTFDSNYQNFNVDQLHQHQHQEQHQQQQQQHHHHHRQLHQQHHQNQIHINEVPNNRNLFSLQSCGANSVNSGKSQGNQGQFHSSMGANVNQCNSSHNLCGSPSNNSGVGYSTCLRSNSALPKIDLIPRENEFDLVRVMQGVDYRTTIMIRNIPNKYSQQMLIDFINESHRGKYDFLYLRMDFKNRCNVGYAFCNMVDSNAIISFAQRVVGKKWTRFNSDKVCMLSYANIQGKLALIEKFRNSSVMDEHPSYRPKIFYTNGSLAGEEEAFPPPTNRLQRNGTSGQMMGHSGGFGSYLVGSGGPANAFHSHPHSNTSYQTMLGQNNINSQGHLLNHQNIHVHNTGEAFAMMPQVAPHIYDGPLVHSPTANSQPMAHSSYPPLHAGNFVHHSEQDNRNGKQIPSTLPPGKTNPHANHGNNFNNRFNDFDRLDPATFPSNGNQNGLIKDGLDVEFCDLNPHHAASVKHEGFNRF